MINKDLINQTFLDEEIKSLEKGYMETVINLIKWPVFIESCSKAILETEGEQKEALEKTLFIHEKNDKTNKEAIEQLERIIIEVKKFKN